MTAGTFRALEPSAAWRKTLWIGGAGSVVGFFAVGAIYHTLPWYQKTLSGSVAVAGSVGGFASVYTFLMCFYHRKSFLGAVAGVVGFALPLAGVFALLFALRLPANRAQFWVALPACLIGEAIFEVVKKLHFGSGTVKSVNGE